MLAIGRRRYSCAPNVRVERSAASLPHIEATLSKTATSLYPFRSYRPRSRSNALLGACQTFDDSGVRLTHMHIAKATGPTARTIAVMLVSVERHSNGIYDLVLRTVADLSICELPHSRKPTDERFDSVTDQTPQTRRMPKGVATLPRATASGTATRTTGQSHHTPTGYRQKRVDRVWFA